MGKAISHTKREKIVARCQAGHGYELIASDLGLSISGVKKIWYSYQKEGPSALNAKYKNCGRKTKYDSTIRELVAALRTNEQGADYVRSKFIQQYPDSEAPSSRTIQRWWVKKEDNRAKGRPSDKEKKNWSQEAHEIWQIDGKEQIDLASGEQVSWMNVADEGTSGHLKAFVHEAKYVVSIDLQTFTQQLNTCFAQWGLPKTIKVDNGGPIVNPRVMDVPTKAKLWWVGLGIKVIQNSPGKPQENGTVEALQGIMKSWSNPSGCADIAELQERLDEESDFQKNHYQMPKKDYQTRIQLHPELLTNARNYDPKKFDIQLVYNHLSNYVWERKVKKNGEIKIFGTVIYIGKKYAEKMLDIILDPIEQVWVCRKLDGTVLKQSGKGIPNAEEIIQFATM